MQPMAASLSDNDIRNVAAWFAAQKPPVATANGPGDPALRATGAKLAQGNRCAACHKDDFSGAPQQATPRLAAQREDYLAEGACASSRPARASAAVSPRWPTWCSRSTMPT